MNTVKIRDIEIGAGAPKIIVPIVGVTKEDIIEEAKTFDSIPVDVVEWRVDWFEGVFDFAKVEDVLKDLRAALGNIPLLMTFRTSKEGGEKAIEPEAYAELNIKAAQTGYVDLIDVEIFTGDEIVKKIIDGAHAAGVKVIASNHDFFKTPAKADISIAITSTATVFSRPNKLPITHTIYPSPNPIAPLVNILIITNKIPGIIPYSNSPHPIIRIMASITASMKKITIHGTHIFFVLISNIISGISISIRLINLIKIICLYIVHPPSLF